MDLFTIFDTITRRSTSADKRVNAYEEEVKKFIEVYQSLYTGPNPVAGVDRTATTTGTGTENPIAPSSSSSNGHSWQSAPALESGTVASQSVDKKETTSAKDDANREAVRDHIQKGDSNADFLGRYVLDLRTRRHLVSPYASRIAESPSIKDFLGLQNLIVDHYKMELERRCETIFGQGTLSWNDLQDTHKVMHSYCEAIDNLEKMQSRTRVHPGYDISSHHSSVQSIASLTKQELLKSLIEEVTEERYTTPDVQHLTTRRDQLMVIFWKVFYLSIAQFFKMMMATMGGLLVTVPMLIIVLDPHRTKASILVVISLSIFILISVLVIIGFFTEIVRIWAPNSLSKAMDIKDMLTIVTAYAAVLMVFVGGYTSGGTERGTIS